MKGEYNIPEDVYYTKEHEWVRLEGDKCRVGVTDYAQNSLHEVAASHRDAFVLWSGAVESREPLFVRQGAERLEIDGFDLGTEQHEIGIEVVQIGLLSLRPRRCAAGKGQQRAAEPSPHARRGAPAVIR